ncbi:hypothetical protein TNIN_120851 [Trichonephila inaurata madagascariensis]|uniref:Uncharacterized protein n=1 Tax=Trichonephila inaurata madagascariensis TaxID=2747483 RepID=A0A8X6YT20_9ARAC|nr:hypothetical protein TNIN_120851 [Trichonephila inaurata madagascariensis]
MPGFKMLAVLTIELREFALQGLRRDILSLIPSNTVTLDYNKMRKKITIESKSSTLHKCPNVSYPKINILYSFPKSLSMSNFLSISSKREIAFPLELSNYEGLPFIPDLTPNLFRSLHLKVY